MRRSFALLAVALVCAPSGRLLGQGTGLVLLPEPQNPVTRVGTRGANFLEIGVGARGQAMAGAYTGIAEGVTALYWNPAGISEVPGPAVAFSIADLYGDLGIKHVFFGGVLPVGTNGAFGISLTQLTSGDMQRTTIGFPEGGDPAFGSTFSYTATAAGLYYARRLTDRLDIGVGFKGITEGIDAAQATYFGLDVGVKFRTQLYGTHIAAALSNLGSSGRVQGALLDGFFVSGTGATVALSQSPAAEQLPTTFRFSITSDVLGPSDALVATNPRHNVQFVAEMADGIDTDIQLALAAQYSYRDMVFLRLGKRFANESQTDFRSGSFGLSYGGGIALPVGGRRFSFDYAYTNMADLKNVQVFSLELGF
jgi:hypothetical protein